MLSWASNTTGLCVSTGVLWLPVIPEQSSEVPQTQPKHLVCRGGAHTEKKHRAGDLLLPCLGLQGSRAEGLAVLPFISSMLTLHPRFTLEDSFQLQKPNSCLNQKSVTSSKTSSSLDLMGLWGAPTAALRDVAQPALGALWQTELICGTPQCNSARQKLHFTRCYLPPSPVCLLSQSNFSYPFDL